MPTPEQILDGLTSIANSWIWLALFWHGYFAIFALALLGGFRPARRLTGLLLSLPLLSVGALAWLAGNPFNGTTFTLSGAALIAIATFLPRGSVLTAPWWAVVPGVVMFAFGWVYPHFLDTDSVMPYLYSAPTGLVPCPTLSIVIGIAMVVGGLGSRAWSFVLAGMGLFYGVFGAVRLGVQIDWILLFGTLVFVLVVIAGGREGMSL
jgi:hypothetical protein